MATEEGWTIANKVCIVTGSNSGIGRVTALALAKQGAAKVILACRNVKAAEEVAKDIREKVGYTNETEAKQRVVVKQVDVSNFESVRKFAADINSNEQALHVLVNNAGLEQVERKVTPDGYEMTFGTNHLGPFLLTNLLLELLKKSAPSRIVNVGSKMYMFCWPRGINLDDPNMEKRRFNGTIAYCQSKLANILTTRELHRRLNIEPGRSSGVSVFSLHPGFMNSNFLHNRRGCSLFMGKIFFSAVGTVTLEQGAATSIFCATQPGIEQHSGKFFAWSKLASPWAIARDDAKAKALWELSEKFISSKQPSAESSK